MVDHKTLEQAVGVFDSGVGGLSVLQAMLEYLPAEHFTFVADERCLPYGDKPQHEITDRVLTLSNWLRNTGCKALGDGLQYSHRSGCQSGAGHALELADRGYRTRRETCQHDDQDWCGRYLGYHQHRGQ
jgi:hypothetical protein